MRLTSMLLVVGAASTLSAADDTDAKAAEVKKLQGTWTIVSGEFSGKAMTPKDVGLDKIVVTGEKMALMRGDKEVAVYPFEVHPDKKPRGMTWTKKMGEKEGKLPVIYELDGTKLKICFPLLPGKPAEKPPTPPENFETKDKPLGLVIAEKTK
jgi:uncharacterized protein (TIGR03067 family)